MHALVLGPLALWFQQPSPANPLGSLWMLAAVAGIFYFLIFLPSQKQKKEQQAMLESLEAGKEVITTGGITGVIVSVSPDSVVLRVRPDNVKLQVARSAVTSVVAPPVDGLDKKS